MLARLREGEQVPDDPGSQTALEALVQLDGRPALRLGDDGVDPDDPELGEWQGAVVLHPTFAVKQRSVCRIDSMPGTHAGTGFVVGDGLVMTNRHVLEVLAFPTPSRSNPSGWVLNGTPVVNFSPSGADTTQTFRILDVVFSGPDPVEGRVDLSHLDLAILRSSGRTPRAWSSHPPSRCPASRALSPLPSCSWSGTPPCPRCSPATRTAGAEWTSFADSRRSTT